MDEARDVGAESHGGHKHANDDGELVNRITGVAGYGAGEEFVDKPQTAITSANSSADWASSGAAASLDSVTVS